MSEALNKLEDAVEDMVLHGPPKQKRRTGERNGFMYAMQNGTGLVVVRLCFLLLMLVGAAGVYIWNLTLSTIHGDLHAVRQDIHGVADDLKGMRIDIAQVQTKQAATDQRITDLWVKH